MTTGEILRAAANLLRTRGHCKEMLLGSGGEYCLRGAILEVNGMLGRINNRSFIKLRNGRDEEDNEFYEFLWEVVHPPVADDSQFTQRPKMHDLVYWNNHADTTAEEVIAALEKAADLWESRQVVPEPEYEYA